MNVYYGGVTVNVYSQPGQDISALADEIEERINWDDRLLFNPDVRNARKEYATNFFRICNELGLSPQSRAKLGSLALKRDEAENDPILKLFGGEES